MPGRIIMPTLRFGRHDLTLALHAFASGATDVLSFLALSGVFTSAMTPIRHCWALPWVRDNPAPQYVHLPASPGF